MSYLNNMVSECGTWADETFSKATPESICKHLTKEVKELSDNNNDVEEAADCILLIFHLAHKRNWNLEQAVVNKFIINQGRAWGKPDADGVVEHVRELGQ